MSEFLKRIAERRILVTAEQDPETLASRLSALMRRALKRLPKIDEFRKTELVQSVYYPAFLLHSEIKNSGVVRTGITFQTGYLEELYDDKFKTNKEK